MTLIATTTETRSNVGLTVHPGTYKIREVLCEQSGYVARENHGKRHRAKVHK